MSSAAGVTVTRVRPGGRDEHGDALPGTELAIRRCIVAPRTGTEDDDKGEAVIVGLNLFAPFEADIEATDQIRIDEPAWAADTYDVVGRPGRWQSPYSRIRRGTQVALTRHS